MGAEGAAEIIFRKEIQEAEDPAAALAARIAEYRAEFANPFVAASRGLIDDVIEPKDTRRLLIQALQAVKSKRQARPPKKHGNIPL